MGTSRLHIKYCFQRLIRSVAVPALLIGGLGSASAQQMLWCEGQITHTYVHANGNLYVFGTWRNDFQQVCNLNSAWNNVPTTTCKAWLSIAELAVATGRNTMINIWASSCSTLLTYESAPAPNYIMLKP